MWNIFKDQQGIINPFNDINRDYGMNKNINICSKYLYDATLVVIFMNLQNMKKEVLVIH